MSVGFDDFTQDDWTTGEFADAPAVPSDPNDFVIPDFVFETDVEQIEQEQKDREFAAPPPGTYLFNVVGLLSPPKLTDKKGYIGGQEVSYKVYSATLKLAVAGKSNLTMLEYIELPHPDPKQQEVFRNAAKYDDGKNPGFMYRKLEQILKRLGFPCVAGQPLPKEALAVRNWVGRQVYATVQLGRQKINPATGKPQVDVKTGFPYPAKAEIKMFSYREAESTVIAGAAPAGGPVAHAGQQSPAGRPAAPAPRGESASNAEFLKAGLANL